MRITIIGIKIKVLQRLGIAVIKAIVTVEPAATPRIVRILSLKIFTLYNFIPRRAAIKQLASGPNNHGSGNLNHKNNNAPVKQIV